MLSTKCSYSTGALYFAAKHLQNSSFLSRTKFDIENLVSLSRRTEKSFIDRILNQERFGFLLRMTVLDQLMRVTWGVLIAAVVLISPSHAQAALLPSIEHSISVTAIVPETPITRSGVAWHSTVRAPHSLEVGEPIEIDVQILGLQNKPRSNHNVVIVVQTQQGRVLSTKQARTDASGSARVTFAGAPAPGTYRVIVTDITSASPLIILQQPEIFVPTVPTVPADRTQPVGSTDISPVSLSLAPPILTASFNSYSDPLGRSISMSTLAVDDQRWHISPG